jgi:hydroxymethylglutaryl-CoA lyase
MTAISRTVTSDTVAIRPVTTKAVTIREVGPRDGLQSEQPVAAAERARLIDALAATGVRHIEAVSFVSPQAVPAMADPEAVLSAIDRRADITWWALVPNRRGADMAVAAGIEALTVTISADAAYNEKNVRMTVADSESAISEIVTVAGERPIDAVVSCCFGSPYSGETDPADVAALGARLLDRGVTQITLADTTGMATPARVRVLLDVCGTDVGLHLHDTRGTALVTAYEAIRCGVSRFDTSAGGLGGSPFAKGAGGNLPTEDLVHLLDDEGVATGIDLGRLLDAVAVLREVVGHDVPGRIATHGPRTNA